LFITQTVRNKEVRNYFDPFAIEQADGIVASLEETQAPLQSAFRICTTSLFRRASPAVMLSAAWAMKAS